MDEIDVSSFEESSNGSDIGSWGSEYDDLGCSEPSAELYHDDSNSVDGQGDSVADSDMTNLREGVESNDDVSDLESDEVNKAMLVLLTGIYLHVYVSCIELRDRRLL